MAMVDKNIPTMSLQEVYDVMNHYMPSFFRIKLGVMADFMDVANIPFGSFADANSKMDAVTKHLGCIAMTRRTYVL